MKVFKQKILLILMLFCIIFFSGYSVKANSSLYYCYDSTCSLWLDALFRSGISEYDEIDSWTYTPSTSGYYVIETYGPTDMYMYTDISNVQFDNNDGGEKLNSNIGFYAVAGTQYVFYVTTNSYYATGMYYIQIRKQAVTIITADYGDSDINTIPDSYTPISELSSMGYKVFDLQNYSESSLNNDDNTGLNRFNKEVVFFSGHGGEGVIVISDSQYNHTYLYSTELPYMGNVKTVVWASCESSTSSSTRNSMAEQSIINGAKSSVGWPETIAVSSSRTFTNKFYRHLADGYTVSQSASFGASKVLWPWDNVKDYEVLGDGTTVINYTVNDKQDTISYVPEYTFANYPLSFKDSSTSIISSEYLSTGVVKGTLTYSLGKMFNSQENVERHFLTLNGYLTNDYYDTINNGTKILCQSRQSFSDEDLTVAKKFGKVTYKIDTSILEEKYGIRNIDNINQHIVFVKYCDEIIPISIFYIDYLDRNNGYTMQDVICYNIITNEEINYEDFSTIS